MRKILLNLADKIYSKYGFPRIDMYARVLYKNHLYKVAEIKTEESEYAFETLSLKLHPDMSLREYLDNRKNNRI